MTQSRRSFLKTGAIVAGGLSLNNTLLQSAIANTNMLAKGPFEPNWESLQQYKTPQWFSDAKFGIWAVFGPQCQAEYGDWYARRMYNEGDRCYNYHVQKYGHPSKFGFKDLVHEWKAENWDPDALLSLYKTTGAQYFFAMVNHHDNFDAFDSKYQQWNSMNVGPKKDIIGGWAKATKKQGMRFGVSVHASHAWTWMETAKRADKKGPLAGVPYDGFLQKKDGTGTWWDGMDPQALYEQNHELSIGSDDVNSIHKQWRWDNGASIPSKAYCDKFLNRTIDLIDKYDPDLLYFDDSILPLYPISDAGLKIAAHFYNTNLKRRGKLEAILNGKDLDEIQKKCMVWDIERGSSNTLEPLPWQTDTCIGDWHYDRTIYDRNRYKTAKTVIHDLADIVSKNGNLLLSIPVRGDGTIDEKETAIVNGIAEWVKLNGESIFSTRPWKVFGEGPAQEKPVALSNGLGFNEGKGVPFTYKDIRFTTKGDVLYAIVLGWPEDGKVLIKSLAADSKLRPEPINRVDLCGGPSLQFERKAEGLEIKLATDKLATNYAFALRIS
ncbi:alpha-L-fucosidase [uncultured Mucilaginibacter sp.]|uniref:alpha-L-fucosidase n=1 Tax=uncultured Mucilaginibacter sp. TaxID=797541 RepID=UPI0025EB250D|nr:alpha-L-fucosidase [uncultured Mucilaginibacter sp.]